MAASGRDTETVETDEDGVPLEADYRPSVRLSAQAELRLLDEALDEARARPKPPPRTFAPPLSPPHAHRRRPETLPRPNGDLPAETADDGLPAEPPERVAVNGYHVPLEELLDSGDDVVVDRKRLIAAIICILQDELTKGTRRPTGRRSSKGPKARAGKAAAKRGSAAG